LFYLHKNANNARHITVKAVTERSEYGQSGSATAAH
jgi:hypothetical protein